MLVPGGLAPLFFSAGETGLRIHGITVTTETVDATTHTVNVPAGAEAGDLILVLGAIDGITSVFSTPLTILYLDNATDSALFGGWKKAVGGDTTVSVTTFAAEKMCSVCYLIKGAADPTVTPPSISTLATSTVGAPDSNAITGLTLKEYLFFSHAANQAGRYADGAPTNYGNLQVSGDPGNSTVAGCSVAQRFLEATGDDPGAFSIPTVSAWKARTLAVHPA